jgi:ATP-dependent RNA circularization protein (DNA/RNA ligase family)
MRTFYRFPQTPHIAWLGSTPLRGDKVLSRDTIEQLLSKEIIVEEKVDGANIGLSLDGQETIQVQNRGDYVRAPYIGQFKHLPLWIKDHSYTLLQYLTPDMIIFGEWCAARHNLEYTDLPDYFLLFDIYDRESDRFWSADRRNRWAARAGLHTVPRISYGHFSLTDLLMMLRNVTSRYRNGPAEGLVIRKDVGSWNIGRGKLVQQEFTQTMTDHWTSQSIQWNRLATY